MSRSLLTADQAARRLGVKVETVYAYVSRGVLERTLSEDGRTSRFDVAEVEALARRGRPRKETQRAGTVEVTLASAITGIAGDRLVFRGHDATVLARESTFEAVAELLWTSVLNGDVAWPAPGERVRVAKAATSALAPSSGFLERLFVATAAAATAYPLRVNLGVEAVVEHARALLTTYVQVLPYLSDSPREHKTSPHDFAKRLLPRLSSLPLSPARVALLDATLILLSDHELATSTLAARVAASTRANPFGVVLAGLGAVSGPLHGKAAVAAHRMILDLATSSPERAVARALEAPGFRAGEERGRVPGFGHPVYRGVDPRAAHLLERLGSVVRAPAREKLHALIRTASDVSSAEPNVDLALGAVAFALEMPVGATEAVFAIARTAGWIAHAVEEYGEAPLRFRARALYTGFSSFESDA